MLGTGTRIDEYGYGKPVDEPTLTNR
jgi:hypothetical protein